MKNNWSRNNDWSRDKDISNINDCCTTIMQGHRCQCQGCHKFSKTAKKWKNAPNNVLCRTCHDKVTKYNLLQLQHELNGKYGASDMYFFINYIADEVI